jgi:hypothetical protein
MTQIMPAPALDTDPMREIAKDFLVDMPSTVRTLPLTTRRIQANSDSMEIKLDEGNRFMYIWLSLLTASLLINNL